MRTRWAIVASWCLAFSATAGEGPSAATRPVTPPEAAFFESRVRPVLVENCVPCHGPGKQKSGLRLDSRPALMEGNGNGPLLVPGKPDASLLIEVVRRDGPIKMPPAKALNSEAVADLTTWVRMGAPWPEPVAPATPGVSSADGGGRGRHWAFRPVRNPPLPAVRQSDWPRTSVDRFVLSALEANGLSPPSPAADKRTLIRRATFDLIGLPPTPAEVAAFEADPSPDAFDTVVDRLLASPHYGERWGRHWLDVARYADTKGYILFEDANYAWSYTYRDYVIQAFNEDLPYDRFIVEQLAADRLSPGRTQPSLRALGFLTLGSRFMNNVHDVIDDRIDVVTRGLLGLTVACARCHDHKFDPIPTEDYYSLYGVFASSVEPATPPLYEQPPATPRYIAFVEKLRERERKLAEFVASKHRELVAGARERVAEYLVAAQAALGQPTTEEFMLLANGGDLNPAMLVRWRGYLERTRQRHHPVFAHWHALAGLPADDFAAGARDLCDRLSRSVDLSRPINRLVARAFAEHPPGSLAEAAQIYSRLLNGVELRRREAAQRTSSPRTDPPTGPDPSEEELVRVFHGPDAPPEVPFDPYGDLALLPDRPSQARLKELRDAVVSWRSTGPGAPPRAMALEDLPTPVEPRVFLRGNAHNPGRFVPRRFLGALTDGERRPFQIGGGRLELAKAIAARDNPLTARVLVNRVWMHHFGAPLVRTSSDFGLRSEPPTHPELLDHLAAIFMDGDWSIKALHRRIMLSSTYRQSSDDRPAAREADPENRLLWKMNRRRLDFETARDALLAVSGRIDARIGGPSLQDITGKSAARRTLYGFVDRLNLPGLYRTFDFPDPNATSPGRDTTMVAPQALFFMNHPFVLETAEALLNRPEIATEDDRTRRVDRLHAVIFQRKPGAEGQDWAAAFLTAEGATAASWRRYAHALLISNEFLFID